MCRFHHTLVHEGRWRIHLDDRTGSVTATRPNGTPYEIRDHRTGPGPGLGPSPPT
ncbi:hypothetical protein [Rugosimonospora africana]|uniref:Uncharacterized protein n=1 Tax=Rugosimonospora africana TaxID=556532 RepID=A0A8J3QUS6_9ACTN|nr:hypothetical protein [Rugosimonospora africana]GIH16487.1 hypothetical protein Raf01_46590 [Rugosimonospora africana]